MACRDSEKRVLPQREGRGQRTLAPQVLEGAQLVRMRVEVWWALDHCFYSGVITCHRQTGAKHTYDILYDDGESEEGVQFSDYLMIKKGDQDIVRVS